MKIKLLLIAFLITGSSYLACSSIPVYLKWRSSYSYLFYKIGEDETTQQRDMYKVNTGIDTTFYNNIRTRVEITNLDDRIDSQVIFDHINIDYCTKYVDLALSMEDYGFGNDYFLYNRRNDDVSFNKNVLINYRWNGIRTFAKFNNHKLGGGIGGNDINSFISLVQYNFKNDIVNMNLFNFFVQRHNHYTEPAYQWGADIKIKKSIIDIQSGFVYQYLPETSYDDKRTGWYFINELEVKLYPFSGLILSSEHQTAPESDKTEYMYQACFDVRYWKLQSFAGAQEKSIIHDKVRTYFIDVNYFVLSNLSGGLFFDTVIFSRNRDYHRIGFQVNYQSN